MPDLTTLLLADDACVEKGGDGSGIHGHITHKAADDKSAIARGATARARSSNSPAAHAMAAKLHRRAARAQAAAGDYSAARAHQRVACHHDSAAMAVSEEK
jgi:hypothetical protein